MMYAGIGARKTPLEILEKMAELAGLLAPHFTVCTGAALGADQAFATGALNQGGKAELFLPWPKYEKTWVNNIRNTYGDLVNITSYIREDAYYSVDQFHPNPAALSQGVRKLHARNYEIILGCKFVICWTPDGQMVGGTAQGIKIANSLNIPVYNLFDWTSVVTVDAAQTLINHKWE